jgi:hypothetical protein
MAVSFWVACIILLMCFGVLHHDNAPAYRALSVREFLASKQITMLEHPPSSKIVLKGGLGTGIGA